MKLEREIVLHGYTPLVTLISKIPTHHLIKADQTCFDPKVNSDCDGDHDSYDAMVLLTGRQDFIGDTLKA